MNPLTNQEKRMIAERMKWKWQFVHVLFKPNNKLEFIRERKDGYQPFYTVNFDLNDAPLVGEKLVKQGKWFKFLKLADQLAFEDAEISNLRNRECNVTAWLLTMHNGEAKNFFRAYYKFIEKEEK